MVTALLKFNGFVKKVKMQTPLQEYREIVRGRLTISSLQDLFHPNQPNSPKVIVFEWKNQIGKYTHEYTLKEIV